MARPSDLPSTAELAATKPHGHKLRYVAGCRCWRCKRGNRDYERELDRKRALYGPNDLVRVTRVRQFLNDLQKLGIGYMTVAKHVRVGKTGMGTILWPGKDTKTFIRRRTESKILSYRVTLDTMPLHLKIPAAETVARIKQLAQWGYSNFLVGQIALRHGKKTPLSILSVNGKRSQVKVKTAIAIRDFYNRIVAIRELWTAHRGLIPFGFFLFWKDRRRGDQLTNLELRRVNENHAYFHFYPQELKEAKKALRKVRLHLRERKKHAEEQQQSQQ